MAISTSTGEDTACPSASDRLRVRELAQRVRELATGAENQRRIAAWKDHNTLRGERPMMLIFPEGGWEEIMAQHPLQCSHPLARSIEQKLWQQLYSWDHFASDHVLDAEYVVPKAIWNDGWGIEERWRHSEMERGSRTFVPVIHTVADLERLRFPTLQHDPEESARRLERHQDLLEGTLPVRLRGIAHVSFHLMMQLTAWRGLEQVMMDMATDPDFVHRAMELLTQGHLQLLEQYEQSQLMESNSDNTYHSSGGNGWCDDLSPADPSRIRLGELWASAEAQELAQVSPAMHREFALSYEARLLAPFARTGYGCCEDLTRKLPDILELVPNIRRISISPWGQVDRCAETLGNRAIFSWKPQPAQLVGDFDEAAIGRSIDHTLEVCATNGCSLEIILKDTHSCEQRIERFDRWSRICRGCIDRRYG